MMVLLPVVLSGVLPLASAPVPAPDPAHDPAAYAAVLSEPLRRVRTTDKTVHALLLDGIRRSPTFAALVGSLNASDVIVYIERVDKIAPNVSGQLMLVPVAGTQRYLRVQVVTNMTRTESIAMIGHELRHALEVAAAPQVRTQEDLKRLYKRIGERGDGLDTFDTPAAQNAGRQVKLELVG